MYNFLIGPKEIFDLQHGLISFLCQKCMYMHTKEKKIYIWFTDIQKMPLVRSSVTSHVYMAFGVVSLFYSGCGINMTSVK